MSLPIKPYAILPLLVEQPTWGGTYIAASKNITDPVVADSLFGQAYELAGETVLASVFEEKPAYIVSGPDLKNQVTHNSISPTVSLVDLIRHNPVEVLGHRVTEKYGAIMPLLIKFTQAQENSYQVHVTQATGNWLPKPESWYFFENGKATLGLKPNQDLQAYQARCQAIEATALRLSANVQQGLVSVDAARQELDQFIESDHPRNYINTIDIPAESYIDLSSGGIHHSWEKTSTPNSVGNIVYEVQLDVKDDRCTLRSFDQGKMKDDGTVRPLSIDEYFAALVTDPELNDPNQLVKHLNTTQDTHTTRIFSTQHYALTKLVFSGTYPGTATTTTGSFHHLYAKKGSVTVKTATDELTIPQGWSGFIPAGISAYQLYTDQAAEVLLTAIGD